MYSSKMVTGGRPGPDHEPSIRFAVVGNKRTGSSHLCSLLDSHPDIACWDDEILEAGNEFDTSSYDRPADFLTDVVFRVPVEVVGFRMMWEGMDRWPDVWAMLEGLDIWLIHVTRENRLDSFISFKLATINDSFTSAYGQWRQHSFVADHHEALEWFETTLDRDEKIRDLASKHGRPRLELEYGEICTGPAKALDFLGQRPTPLKSAYSKQGSGSQAGAIANYEELRASFAATTWSRYFTGR